MQTAHCVRQDMLIVARWVGSAPWSRSVIPWPRRPVFVVESLYSVAISRIMCVLITMAYVSNMMHVSMSASVSITGTVAVTVLPSVSSATRALGNSRLEHAHCDITGPVWLLKQCFACCGWSHDDTEWARTSSRVGLRAELFHVCYVRIILYHMPFDVWSHIRLTRLGIKLPHVHLVERIRRPHDFEGYFSGLIIVVAKHRESITRGKRGVSTYRRRWSGGSRLSFRSRQPSPTFSRKREVGRGRGRRCGIIFVIRVA